MFEKNLEMSLLLDFYGVMLTERKRGVMNLYYNEDFSLAEIADELGISRQGVRELIKKSETELLLLEERLGLARRFASLRRLAEAANAELEAAEVPDSLRRAVSALTEAVGK